MSTLVATGTRGIRRWWPSAAGAVVAGWVALDLTADGGAAQAPILAASTVMYLGAAALQRREAAWPMFFGTLVLITVAKLAADQTDPTWFLLGAAALLAVYGLLRGAARPATGLPLQTLAMIGFGAVAVSALAVSPDLGAYLVSAGLLGHAAWDVHHHRTGRVVVRSLAQFCFVLDTLLAVAIVAVTVLT